MRRPSLSTWLLVEPCTIFAEMGMARKQNCVCVRPDVSEKDSWRLRKVELGTRYISSQHPRPGAIPWAKPSTPASTKGEEKRPGRMRRADLPLLSQGGRTR